VIRWLGQGATCQRGATLPPGYLDGDDVAYLPGVAPDDTPPPAPPTAPSVLLPIALAVTVVALFWRFR
jgi:hypothetical protein